jgi:hypothetical protein
MRAEITYNGGASYSIRGYKFLRGKTVVVNNPEVIERLAHMVGFSVRRLATEEKKKVVKKVVKKVAPETRRVRDEEDTTPSPVKKKRKKSSSY